MLPSDYRLDFVAARLLERLEGMRPTFAGRPDEATLAFERAAKEQIEAALSEFREVVGEADAAHQGGFLRREVRETLLPRYHRLATRMTADEEGSYGLGRLASPLGRIGLVAFSLLFLFPLSRWIYLPVSWPVDFAFIALPFVPDLARALRRRQYERQLRALLGDMTRIQDQVLAYWITEIKPTAQEAPPQRSEAK